MGSQFIASSTCRVECYEFCWFCGTGCQAKSEKFKGNEAGEEPVKGGVVQLILCVASLCSLMVGHGLTKVAVNYFYVCYLVGDVLLL